MSGAVNPSSAASRVSSFAFVQLPELEPRRYQVLVVDDDESALQLIEHCLKSATDFECEASLAKDAAEAKSKLSSDRFDAVLADQMMPGENGIELLMHVKEEYPQTLRILITAYSSLGAVLRAVNLAQVHSYIEKPFDPRHLNRAVYEALLRRQERQKTQVMNARSVEDALQMLQGLERALGGAPTRPDGAGVTFTFDSPVDFNQFIFEILQAKASVIKDVHVFEGRFHVMVSIQSTSGKA
ncbi:MAG: response regulator [Euryarchaeota archaeon]|nr:response regulator [Euryarchaeota archaeon]MDE1837094.1 response regulator [Euryarchaeota archaeon]MDE1879694.1 response regulator [Euryarchaeota archaeon]MDE2045220.1 response regulator [Thermoplasmata archaeon]